MNELKSFKDFINEGDGVAFKRISKGLQGLEKGWKALIVEFIKKERTATLKDIIKYMAEEVDQTDSGYVEQMIDSLIEDKVIKSAGTNKYKIK